ncbi:hypothetical protein EDF60_1498 [Leucobacter luti]|nr:hypothetical protein [Leucobacter luti]TCK46246.1 hypothetical protein EDF60_1498 [Leucobacter luti]
MTAPAAPTRSEVLPLTMRTRAAKVSSELWELRAICTQWHTVFKRMSHPNVDYACPWCDADVR